MEDMEVESSQDTTVERDPPKSVKEQAEDLKNAGNEHYKKSNYKLALDLYSKAIDLCPEVAAFYSNRSACYMMCNNYELALQDSRHAIRLDHSFIKAYLREGRCLLNLGDTGSAKSSFEQVLNREPGNAKAKQELQLTNRLEQLESAFNKEFEKNDFRHALFNMDQCLQLIDSCNKYKVHKAECLVMLGKTAEAQSVVYSVLLADSSDVEALYVRGLAMYYEEMYDKAQQHFQQVLRLAPDHYRARSTFKRLKQLQEKKAVAKQAFASRDWAKAKQLYTDTMSIEPACRMSQAKLYYNRALCHSGLNEHIDVVKDCSSALELDPDYIKAYVRRAKSYLQTEQFEEAVRDCEKFHKMDPTREHKQLLQEAKLELKKSKRKDYYKILGINKHASDDDIKRAYKKRAMIHHPDRHAHDSTDVQKEEEKKFKEVGEAYSILSDSKKKARYDMGHDIDDLDGHGGFPGGADIDPNIIFQQFFGGGGGAPGGGFGGFSQGPAGGMPGFTFKFS